MGIIGFGGRALIPDELLEGFGPDPAILPDGYLIRPAIPLGGWVLDSGYPNAWQTRLVVLTGNFAAAPAWIREQVNRCLIWQSAYDAIINGIGRVGGTPFPNPQFVFRWRPKGSVDGTPWVEIPGQYLGVSLASVDSTVTAGNRLIYRVDIEDRRLNPSDPDYDAATTALPADDAEIEFFLIGPLPPDEHHPIVVSGMTAGEFLVNAYAGNYSARDPDTGAVVPTGIRYDATAVRLLTRPVLFILDKPIEDLRDWAEKHIYQPHGWVPALDNQGYISPVSQEPPDDISGLPVIDDAGAALVPDWSAGDTIVNLIRFTYRRYYSAPPPDPRPQFDGIPRQNMLKWVDVEAVFIDPLSILRHGEKPLEIDGLAFGALGIPPADETVVPPSRPRVVGRGPGRSSRPFTDQVVVESGLYVQPVSGDIADETGYQLALERWEHVLTRYSFGAPTMRRPVRRSTIPGIRAGSWVVLNLADYPDYVTGLRGLQALAQVVALGELSCAWRNVKVEQVPLPATS